MSDTFKVGDVVRPKGGGPRMTVEGKANAIGQVPVVWFSYAGNDAWIGPHRDEIKTDALERCASLNVGP